MPRPSIVGTTTGTVATSNDFSEVTLTVPAGAKAICMAFGGFAGSAMSVVSVQGNPGGTPYDLDDFAQYTQLNNLDTYSGLYVIYDTNANWPGTGSVTLRVTISSANRQLKACGFCLADVDTAGTPVNDFELNSGTAVVPSFTLASSATSLNIAAVASYSANISGGDDTSIYQEYNSTASSSYYVWSEDGVDADTVEGNASVDFAGISVSFEGEAVAPSRSITNIDADNDVQAGQTGASITGVGFALPIVSVTLGGEAVTITDTPTTTNVNVTIPLHINMKWGTSGNLVVTDQTGALTLGSVTLSAATGATLIAQTAIPDLSKASFHRYAITDAEVGNFTSAIADTLVFQDGTGMAVDAETVPTINPAATITGWYKFWDESLGTFTPLSSYEWVNAVASPTLSIDSIIDVTPDAGSTTAILISNEAGTVTASCSAGALSGTYTSGQFILDVPEPGLFGNQTLNYETPIVVTLSDGTTNDTASIQIQVPAGELFAEITDIDAAGIYGNDVGLVVGDFAHIKNIVGDIVIDPATGLYSANPSSNVSFDYSLYDITDNTWSDAYATNSYTAETVIPVITLRGGSPLVWVQGASWVDPGADVIDNVDNARIILADSPPNINTVSSQVILYNATDNAGNVAVQVARTVNVVAADSTPDQFTFVDVLNAELNTMYLSDRSIVDVDVGQTLTVTNGQLSNDNGVTWSSSVSMVTGQTLVRASITTGNIYSQLINISPIVNGSVTDTFSVTAKAIVISTYTFGELDPLVVLDGAALTNITYTFPIGEVWTAAPEEGGTLVDSTVDVSIIDGTGTMISSLATPATDYLVILRDSGNLPSRYFRDWGQFV